MNATKTLKLLAISVFAITAVVLTSIGALAADPYDGVNRIGTYYQYTNTVAYNTQSDFQYYNYIAPPRAGGWFGSGTEWLVGLRSPVYTPVPPVQYTSYYTPTCGYPCWFNGGYGYPMATASSFQNSQDRLGGVFSY